MLSRVARRRAALRHLERSSEHLVAPWLCPALLRSQSHSKRVGSSFTKAAASATLAAEQQRRTPRRFTALQQQSSRNLATAAEQYEPHGSSHIPFEQPMGLYNPLTGQATTPQPPPQGLPDFDPSSLIIIDHSLMTRPKTYKRSGGVGGDELEMESDLDMSLSIGRFDRAMQLLKRLGPKNREDPERSLELHNKFLRAAVSHAITHRSTNMVWPIQKWFEVDMQHNCAHVDAVSYALMIRMTLRLLHGSRRDRTVRRYWSLAKDKEIEEDVLGVPILSELELGELSEICFTDLNSAPLGEFGIDTQMPPEDMEAAFNLEAIFEKASGIPEARAAEQKGEGLNSLKHSLSLFNDDAKFPYPSHLEGSKAEKDKIYSELRQRKLETDSVQSAIDRWKKEEEIKNANGGDISFLKVGPLLWDWHQQLTAKLKSEIAILTKADGSAGPVKVDETRACYVSYLQALKPDKLAAVTILSALSVMNKAGIERGTKLGTLVIQLGQAVQEEIVAQHVSAQNPRKLLKDRKGLVARMIAERKTNKFRRRWANEMEKVKDELPDTAWPAGTEAGVGAILVSGLLDVAKVRVEKVQPDTQERFVSMQSAFQYTFQLEKGRRIGYVNINSAVAARLRRHGVGELLAKHLPMVSQPKPWTGFYDGGFITQRVPVLRVKEHDQMQKTYAKAAAKRGDLDQVFSGLDVLGATGWKINKGVFDVMLEAWNSGEEVADLAPETFNFDLPPAPPKEDVAARRLWNYQRVELENKKSGFHSQRCFQNFQLEIARAYRNETFYLPHNLDFRGRAYPLPPYFNQMGADNCRGLLLFSKGKPLGEKGLWWLKIHLANVFGFDKASLQERVDFTMKHLDDVLDSANKGLHGKRWWLKAEDPWQCLSACMELRNALDCVHPTEYISRLPVHQDGSCNGLQHYAALGGDIAGARQVNLEPSDRPSDIYTGVSEYVKEDIKKEAAEGVEIAKLLEGKVTRKIVKQTVMTNVYGVTFLGAIRQVRKQMEDYYPELKDSPYSHALCSTYIARKIFKALGSMFSGAHSIQFWLGDCAGRISQSLSPEQINQIINDPELLSKTEAQRNRLKKANDPLSSFNSTVIWTTPLRLPVVQPYRDTKARRVKTSLQDINIKDPHATDTVNKRKQLQAFPPNFIHSLDATHMLLSANRCHELGLTFSAVHDSFWTHAGDIDEMNTALREQFIRMHSDDIMQRLASEFKVRYSKNIFLAQLKRDSPAAKAILAHRKAHKVSKLSELALENKRLTLLASEDPAEQEEGRAMVTPASIFQAIPNSEDSFNHKTSFGETAIGHVPENIEVAEANNPVIEQLSDELDGPEESGFDIPAPQMAGPVEPSPAKTEGADGKAKKKTRKPATAAVWVWLPLTFRPVPKKGDFDVRRLEKSEYFFC
ncbi:DNA-directed RNA polymerase [Arachnomyces sp. PD_36]|nr:DNA-directed RNA polymerase [Arachnomyces sp. PD_36]